PGDDLPRGLPELRREVDQVVLTHALDLNRRRLGWEGLRGSRLLARYTGLRHRAILDRPQRRASHAVEHENVSLLGHLRDCLDAPPVDRYVDEVGGRRQVVIPDVVSGELVVPDPLTRAGVEAHQRVAEEIVAVSVAAVVVVGRRAEGQVNVAQLLVGAHQRPHVGVADGFPRVVLPRLVTDLAGPGYGPEGPQLLSGADVEAAHVADRHSLADGEAQHGGPNHDHVADDHRRRGVTVEP